MGAQVAHQGIRIQIVQQGRNNAHSERSDSSEENRVIILQQQPPKPKQKQIYRRIRCPDHLEDRLVLRAREDEETCDQCGSYSRTFTCQYCHFDICLECYNAPKEYFKCYCSEGHELKFQGNLGNHICDACRKGIDSAYSCRECDTDLCLACKKKFIANFTIRSQKCINQHKKMNLQYKEIDATCSECNDDCFGFWVCKTCDFKRCIQCKFEIEETEY